MKIKILWMSGFKFLKILSEKILLLIYQNLGIDKIPKLTKPN